MASERIGDVTLDGATYAVELDLERGRIDVRFGNAFAFMQVHLRGASLSFIHTEVPNALQGRGIADAMAKAGLEFARAQQWAVKTYCPFVTAYIRRHPEFQDLVTKPN